MATRKVSVEVSDNGSIAELTRQVTNLNTLLDKAAKPRKALTGAASAALSNSRDIDSGLTRGTAAGAKRGETRDFGRQAQGLGGLVHLYATFAANVFAVTAAFTALSNAMNFDNMQKAADILSVNVGTSINSVAKSMKNLTDEAISMTDALASASLAVTAGLNVSQIEKLTTVAKGASIALGRDMTDALNRVFRGTIKIEPELLDELGIMVKVNDANKNYAKTLNKTVTSLTDYERRQAFVNAVTEQGINKYKELADLGANPYSKLIASVRDLGIETLNTMNGAIAPLVSLLAQNPTALLAAGLAIISTLLKQAIPSLKAFSSSLSEIKEKTVQTNLAQLHYFKDLELANKKTAASIDEHTSKLIAMEQAVKNKRTFMPGGQQLAKTLGGLDLFDPKTIEENTTKALAAIDKAILKVRTRLEESKAKIPKMDVSLMSERDALKATEIYEKKLAKLTDTASKHIQELSSHRDTLGLIASGVAAKALQDKELSASARELQKLKVQEASLNRAVQRSIAIRNVVEKTEQLGFRAGFAKLTEEISTGTAEFDRHGVAIEGTLRKYSRVEKAALAARGSLSLLTVGLSKVLGGLGILAGAFLLLNLVLSSLADWLDLTNDKLGKLQESTDKVNESFKLYGDIQDKLSSARNMSEMYELQASSARAYADALESVNNRTKEYNEFIGQTGASGAVDKWIELLKFSFLNKGEFGKEANLSTAKLADKVLKENPQLAKRYQFSGGGSAEQSLSYAHSMPTFGERVKNIRSFGMYDFAQARRDEDIRKMQEVVASNPELIKQQRDFSDASASMTANLKEVNDISGEYLLTLQNQSKHLKALNALSASTVDLFKQLASPSGGITQIEQYLSQQTDQVQQLTQVKLDPKLQQLANNLSAVERIAERNYLEVMATASTAAQREGAAASRTNELEVQKAIEYARYGGKTQVEIDIAKNNLAASISLQKLATAASDATTAQAELARSFKNNQFIASFSDRSASTLAALELKNSIAKVAIDNSAVITNINTLSEDLKRTGDALFGELVSKGRLQDRGPGFTSKDIARIAEDLIKDKSVGSEERRALHGYLSNMISLEGGLKIAQASITANNLTLPTEIEQVLKPQIAAINDWKTIATSNSNNLLLNNTNLLNAQWGSLINVGSEAIDTLVAYKVAILNSTNELDNLKTASGAVEVELALLEQAFKKQKPGSEGYALGQDAVGTKTTELETAKAKVEAARLSNLKIKADFAEVNALKLLKQQNTQKVRGLELDELSGKISKEDLEITKANISYDELSFGIRNKLTEGLKKTNLEAYNLLDSNLKVLQTERDQVIAIANKNKELRIQQDTLTNIEGLFSSNKPSTGLLDATQIGLFVSTYREYLDLQQQIEQNRINELQGNDKLIAQEALRVKYLEKQLALKESTLIAEEKLTGPFQYDGELIARRFELDAKKFRDTLASYNETVVGASYKAVDTFVDGITNAVKNLDFNLKNIIRDTVFAFDDMMMEYAGNQLKAIMRDAIAGMFGKPDMLKSPADLAKERQVILAQQANTYLAQIALNTSSSSAVNNLKLLPLDYLGNSQASMLLTQQAGFSAEDLKGWGGSIDKLVQEGSLSTQQFTDSTKTFADSSKGFLDSFSSSIYEFGVGVADFIKNIFTSPPSSGSSSGGFLSSLFDGDSSWFGSSSSSAASSGYSAADLAWFNSDAMYAGGFATGGSFKVGGQGATDSKLVQFMATPGERVTVETPDQQKASESNTINVVNHFTITGGTTSRESQQQISAKVGLAIQRSLQRNN